LRAISRAAPNSADRWLADFLGQLQRDDLAPATVHGYRYDLRQFLRWFIDAKGSSARFEKLSALDLINYRQHLVKVEGLRPATVNRRLEALRRFCRWAQLSKRLRTNVALDLRPVRTVRNTRPVGLTEPEVHTLLRLAGESGHGLAKRNYALVQLMVQAGLRVGEVAALRIADITAHERSGLVRICEGKGLKAREVPLNATARRALRLYPDTRNGAEATEPLFLSDRGSAMPTRTIRAVIAHLAGRARINRVRVSAHTLRREPFAPTLSRLAIWSRFSQSKRGTRPHKRTWCWDWGRTRIAERVLQNLRRSGQSLVPQKKRRPAAPVYLFGSGLRLAAGNFESEGLYSKRS
jgi:site-specific recombinase XerD